MEAGHTAPVYGTGEVEIAADPETVWGMLADIQDWPSRNPDITQVDLRGPLQPGTIFNWKSEESWSGLLSRLLRRRFITTLKTAIDTGLARLKAEAERRATP